jgi:hypothetical protein
VQQHHEFVATNARHGIGIAHAALEPTRHGLQQHVADRVAKGVVDLFEAIQIDIQQRHVSRRVRAPASAALSRSLSNPRLGNWVS